MIKNKLLIALIATTSLSASPEIKRASTVFQKWIKTQEVFNPINLGQEKEMLAEQFARNFTNVYEQHLPLLRAHHTPFLENLTDHQINKNGHQITDLTRTSIKETLLNLYETTENDMPHFVQMLEDLSFNEGASVATKSTTQQAFEHNLTTNIALCSCIFGQENAYKNNQLKDNAVLFSVANKFAEFCLQPKTFPIFQSMMLHHETYPVAQFLFATMHQRFVRTGWSNWSGQCLKNLKAAADSGKKVVYLAGGSDLYQLIANGIYNITIIDPQLPSQPKYYADDWAWIMKGTPADGGIGDQLIFDAQGIIMTRMSYQEEGKPFKARLADQQIITINPSKTIWRISNHHGQQLGFYTLERRFVEQADFKPSNDHVLLMSFNELFFVAAPDELQGWRIEPSRFSNDTTIFVKHLHKPVTKAEVCNLRTISLLNVTDFKSFPLGLCIN